MNIAFWHKLDTTARNITPALFTLVLVILSVVPLGVPGYAMVAPVLALMSVYHWAIYRPNLLPPVVVFLLGLFQDILGGTPLGLFALVFLTVYGVVLSQRQFFAGKTFMIYWMGFALVAFGAAFESWILGSAWNFAFIQFESLFFQFLLSVGLFPILAWLMLRWQVVVLHRE